MPNIGTPALGWLRNTELASCQVAGTVAMLLAASLIAALFIITRTMLRWNCTVLVG